MEIFEAKQRLMKQLLWSENPFVKDLRSSSKEEFLKYYCPFESDLILRKLAFDAKACLLLGPKGVGKTSALCFVSYLLPSNEFHPVFFKEPPESVNDLAVQTGLVKKSFFSSLFGKKEIKRQELVDSLKGFGKKVVFFLDEAHLEKEGMHMEFKYLLDDVPNLRMVISALGKEGFPDSLLQLVGDSNAFQRTGFTDKEMRTIIAHRIKAVGGSGMKPFPEVFLRSVLSEQNLLSPRYVFDEINNYLGELAVGNSKWKGAAEYANDPIIQSAVLNSEGAGEEVLTKSHANWWISLSPSQQSIMELLLRSQGGLTLADIMSSTKLSQNTAFNALYQMRGDDAAELERKKDVPFPLIEVKGKLIGGRKKNLYFVSPKIKNVFTMH